MCPQGCYPSDWNISCISYSAVFKNEGLLVAWWTKAVGLCHDWTTVNKCFYIICVYIIDHSHYNCWLIPSKIYLSNSINGRCYQTDSRWKLSWVEERRSQTSEGVKSKTYLNPQSKPAVGCWGGGGTERTYNGTWGEAAVAMTAEGELGVFCSLNRPQNLEFANGRCGESGMWHVTYSRAAQVVCLN